MIYARLAVGISTCPRAFDDKVGFLHKRGEAGVYSPLLPATHNERGLKP